MAPDKDKPKPEEATLDIMDKLEEEVFKMVSSLHKQHFKL